MDDKHQTLLGEVCKFYNHSETEAIQLAVRVLASQSIESTKEFVLEPDNGDLFTIALAYTMHGDGGHDVVESYGRFYTKEEAERHVPMFKALMQARGGYESEGSIEVVTLSHYEFMTEETAKFNAQREADRDEE